MYTKIIRSTAILILHTFLLSQTGYATPTHLRQIRTLETAEQEERWIEEIERILGNIELPISAKAYLRAYVVRLYDTLKVLPGVAIKCVDTEEKKGVEIEVMGQVEGEGSIIYREVYTTERSDRGQGFETEIYCKGASGDPLVEDFYAWGWFGESARIDVARAVKIGADEASILARRIEQATRNEQITSIIELGKRVTTANASRAAQLAQTEIAMRPAGQPDTGIYDEWGERGVPASGAAVGEKPVELTLVGGGKNVPERREVVKTLIAKLSNRKLPPNKRQEAAIALGEAGNNDTALVIEAKNALFDAVRDRSRSVRYGAVVGLGKLRPKHLVVDLTPDLIKRLDGSFFGLLFKEKDWWVQEAIVKTLYEIGPKQGARGERLRQALQRVAKNSDVRVAETAERLLSEFPKLILMDDRQTPEPLKRKAQATGDGLALNHSQGSGSGQAAAGGGSRAERAVAALNALRIEDGLLRADTKRLQEDGSSLAIFGSRNGITGTAERPTPLEMAKWLDENLASIVSHEGPWGVQLSTVRDTIKEQGFDSNSEDDIRLIIAQAENVTKPATTPAAAGGEGRASEIAYASDTAEEFLDVGKQPGYRKDLCVRGIERIAEQAGLVISEVNPEPSRRTVEGFQVTDDLSVTVANPNDLEGRVVRFTISRVVGPRDNRFYAIDVLKLTPDGRFRGYTAGYRPTDVFVTGWSTVDGPLAILSYLDELLQRSQVTQAFATIADDAAQPARVARNGAAGSV